MIALLAVADAALLALPSAAVALAVHVALTLLAGAIWLRRGQLSVAPAMLGAAGPIGLLAGIALGGLWPWGGREDALPATDSAPRAAGDLLAKRWLDGRVHHPAPDAVGSLVTVLRHGDVPMRRAALETVVRSFEPALSPLIAQALADPDQTIRALAAAAAARIAANFAATRVQLEAAVAAGAPDAPARLARALEEQARANVLFSDQQRAGWRAEAVRLHDDPAARAAAAWAAGDYAALDALLAAAPAGTLAPLHRWWDVEPA